MSVDKIFILLVFNGQCIERNIMTSCWLLSSFECFLRYFQTEWSLFFTLQCELFKNSNVSSNASFASVRTGGVGGRAMVNQVWTGLDQICAEILYGWPLIRMSDSRINIDNMYTADLWVTSTSLENMATFWWIGGNNPLPKIK